MAKTHKISCPTCGGTGFLPAFAHYARGTCFPCKGRGFYMSAKPRQEPVATKVAATDDGSITTEECRPYRGPSTNDAGGLSEDDARALAEILEWRSPAA